MYPGGQTLQPGASQTPQTSYQGHALLFEEMISRLRWQNAPVSTYPAGQVCQQTGPTP
jgi:hypothetical protein